MQKCLTTSRGDPMLVRRNHLGSPQGTDVKRPPAATDMLDLARRRFLRGERFSVEELAGELRVSRATAYRWAGNAEQLSGEVIASLAEDTFRRAVGEARGRGAARVVDVMARGMRYIAASQAYRAFLAGDPQKALRIVAS